MLATVACPFGRPLLKPENDAMGSPRDSSRLGRMRRAGLLAGLLLLIAAQPMMAQSGSDRWLHVVGAMHGGGEVLLSVNAPGHAGEPVLLALGLDPLPLREPVVTGKGDWYIGTLLDVFAVGTLPADNWLHVPAVLPAATPLVGLHVVLQGYVAGALTNPATLPLDEPYYGWDTAVTITSPQPAQLATFGDRVAVGDLNDDGVPDLVVGAWKESYAGEFFSGRVYVMWGPDHVTGTVLSPPVPKVFGVFGAGFVVTDVNGDGVDDLVVGDGVGDPPVPGEVGNLRVYLGGRDFSDTIAFSIPSPGGEVTYAQYGRPLVTADFNGDGSPDLAVGLLLSPQGLLEAAGRIDIYWGPQFSVRSSLYSPDPGPGDRFGTAMLTVDVNGDGLPDIVEASVFKDVDGVVNIGSAHVFLAPDFTHSITIANPNPQGFNSRFGSAIATADFDGDGFADLVVTDEKGNAYIFFAPDFTSHYRMRRPPQAGGVSYGYFAATGDANGDGIPDIAFSNVFGGPTGGGQVFVALGPYHASHLHLVDPEGNQGASFGWGMHFLDLDEDGVQELLIGSDLASPGGVPGAGKVIRMNP